MKGKPPVPSTIEDAVTASLREGHREFLRFVRRRTNSLDDAEDILQDFYLKAIRSARTIKEAGALKGWLAQVLRRTLTDYYRRAGVRKASLQRLSLEMEEGRPVPTRMGHSSRPCNSRRHRRSDDASLYDPRKSKFN